MSDERGTPARGDEPLSIELAVAADLAIALHAVANNLGRLVGDLAKVEASERRADLIQVGREMGQLGDSLHDARRAFWDAAGYQRLTRPNGVTAHPPAADPAAPSQELTDSGAHRR